MQNNAVGRFEIYVRDMERAKRCYENVFQVKPEQLLVTGMKMWAFPMVMGKMGASGSLVKWRVCLRAATAY